MDNLVASINGGLYCPILILKIQKPYIVDADVIQLVYQCICHVAVT